MFGFKLNPYGALGHVRQPSQESEAPTCILKPLRTPMNNAIEVFPWNENFATGLSLIDEQHKRLVDLINQVATHIVQQSDRTMLSGIFDELAEYTDYHFTTEENIWHSYFSDDEWVAEHEKTHAAFVAALHEIRDKEKDNQPRGPEEILAFLTHWLAFHILENDKRAAKVVLAVESGLTLEEAKKQANTEMTGAMKVLIDTILSMYDNLSARTMQLMQEIIERQKAEARLRLSANVFENTIEPICITDAEAKIIEANPAFHLATGYSRDEIIGAKLSELKSGLANEKLSSAIWETLAKHGHWRGEMSSHTKDGEFNQEWLTLSSIQDEHGNVSNYVCVFSNIELLFQQQHQLEKAAYHDALTGLPNRILLNDRLELAVAHAERTDSSFAVCYLDLDGFKPVNDTLGHAAGDYLLQKMAQRFKSVVRANDTVARMGGDEFVLLLADLKQPDACRAMLDRIIEEILQPIHIQDKSVRVSASIGVAFYPQDNKTPEKLLHLADQAMYHAKWGGKSNYKFYSSLGE